MQRALLQKKQAEEYKALGIHQEDEIEEADTMAQLKHITKAHKEDTNLKQTKKDVRRARDSRGRCSGIWYS